MTVTLEESNKQQVADQIRELLSGKIYTTVTQGMGHAGNLMVNTRQVLNKVEIEDSSGVITLTDTYGVWFLVAGDVVTFSKSKLQVQIRRLFGGVWVFALES